MAKPTIIGDCEAGCESTQVEVWVTRGNILMCASCKAEDDAIATMQEEAIAGNKLLQQLRAVDNASELKADIFNANTVAIVELKGAIWADVNIPDARKQYVYTQELARHLDIQQKKVFDKRAELTVEESIARRWQTAAQEAAGKLTAVEREHFKKLNMAYQPTSVKSVKPAKAGKPTTKAPSYRKQGGEYKEVAERYGVNPEMIRIMVIHRGMTIEAAGKEAAEIMARNKSKQVVSQ
jgi:hypothetical protein